MRFLADENFNNRVLKGVRELLPDVEIVRAQDLEIFQAPDPVLLDWAAKNNYIVITHDKNTLSGDANARIKAGLPMPGVIEVAKNMPIGRAINELSVMIGASTPEDFENIVKYIPIH